MEIPTTALEPAAPSEATNEGDHCGLIDLSNVEPSHPEYWAVLERVRGISERTKPLKKFLPLISTKQARRDKEREHQERIRLFNLKWQFSAAPQPKGNKTKPRRGNNPQTYVAERKGLSRYHQ